MEPSSDESHSSRQRLPDAHRLIGQRVLAEVDSIIPTAGGRMIFARLQGESSSAENNS